MIFTEPSRRHLVTDTSGHWFIPFWVVLLAHIAIGLETMSGGWRIIHTMGSKITKLKPRRLSAVRWRVTSTIVWAWLLTIPASGIVAAVIYLGLSAIQTWFKSQ